MLACLDSRSPAWDKPRSQRQLPKKWTKSGLGDSRPREAALPT
jgi:hypothetical protein